MTQTLDRPETVEMPQPTIPREMRESVARGVAWMDEHFPTYTWEWRIDLDRLDLTDDLNCIVGQVSGNATFMFRLHFLRVSDICYHGFGTWADYAALKACWCEVIRERRGEQHLGKSDGK